MAIDFEQTRDLAKKKIREKKSMEGDKPLTEQEKNDIQFYVKQMEGHVQNYANQGKQTFVYDCSKLQRNVFYALAEAFKAENPEFFVMTRGGCQELTVDWSDSHEV